jgi:hypothetical protein
MTLRALYAGSYAADMVEAMNEAAAHNKQLRAEVSQSRQSIPPRLDQSANHVSPSCHVSDLSQTRHSLGPIHS